MAMMLWAMGLSLLLQGCLCSIGQTDTGCMKWTTHGDNVCCELCHPGNRLVTECGPSPKTLCVPCEPRKYTVNPKSPKCERCTQCEGAQVLVEECTATTDTKCGCRKGLTCGNKGCTFCVKTCEKGQEPTENRSCRPCPEGTFNDQRHQKCKPWSTKCPYPDQEIVDMGDAFTDIKCANVSVSVGIMRPTKKPEHTEEALPLILVGLVSMVLLAFSAIIIITMKIHQKGKPKQQKEEEEEKPPIISTPSDEPRTLIAIECSFHEAQQEQGSSTESLISKDSSERLIG